MHIVLAVSVRLTDAAVTLPHIFADRMVLQRDRPIPIWGQASAGEEVTVSFAGQTRSGKAADDGRWQVVLPGLRKDGPLALSVIGSSGSTQNFKNVLLGEVWLCSGQSNMEMPVGNLNVRGEEAKNAHYSVIRQFRVKGALAKTPQHDCQGEWIECSPKTVWEFSAVSYFFGRKLHQELDCPMGLLVSSMGATWIERWSSRKSLDNDPDVKNFHAGDSLLYNGMIAPLVPYAIRGMIWYQGETNVGNPTGHYRAFLAALIRDRRADFGGQFNYQLPVGIVQLAPFRYLDKDPECCPGMREEQWQAQQSLPDTGLIVTADVGDPKDIHPQRKQAVGDRLALWALAKVYGRSNLVYSGPVYRSMKVEGGKIRLEFDHVGIGLMASDGKPLSCFTIAGRDQVFHLAQASIKGTTVEVSSDHVPSPVAVRFGWRDDAQPNLVNTQRLPAMPFRTDRWRRVTDPIGEIGS